MTSLTSISYEKKRFRRIIIGISLALAAGFLLVGLSFYSLLADQARVATQRAVVQLLEKHKDSFALEVFLHKSGAYQLRIDEVVKDASSIVQDFRICLYKAQGRQILASTLSDCAPEDRESGAEHLRSGYSEITFPIETGQDDDRVIIKARYRDAGSILGAIQELPWTIVMALMMLCAMIFGVSRVLESYNQSIFAKVSKMERDVHTNHAIALTSKMLAHDLRRPFTMIEGMLGLLETSKNPGQLQSVAKRYLPDVRRSMKKINLIMSDINLMGNQVSLKRESANPETLVEASLTAVFGEFKNADITLEYQLHHTHQVLADGLKALRVFDNIFSNSVQAMRGKGHIKVATKDIRVGKNVFVEFRLSNSGNAIPESDLTHLFDPFFTKDKRGGTGLGLAICKQIINQHGGEINVQNLTDGSGVEFAFTLPASETRPCFNGILPIHSSEYSRPFFEQPESQGSVSVLGCESKVLDTQRQLGRNLKVLIADDEALYRTVLIEQISNSPSLATAIDFFEADNVEEAVRLSETCAPDLVIMDIDFGDPERDGFDAVAAIRARGITAKICMHSNRGHGDLAEHCSSKGADYFLPKPMQLRPMFNLLQALS
ncbi:MAG: ATP-binding protein [Oligoflexales bacterium]